MKRYLGKKKLLRIYVDSSDQHEGHPLWQKLLASVKEVGMAGATVFKAVAGIGVHTEVHTFEIWSMAQKLPLIIEIIDDESRVLAFLDRYEDMIGEGMVTMCDIDVLRYKKNSLDETD